MGTGQAEFTTGQRVRVTGPRCPGGASGTIRGILDHSCDVRTDAGAILWAVPFEMVERDLKPDPAPPSHLPGIASGAALWQAKDPANREVMIGIRGDVVTVTASKHPRGDAHTARFTGPVDYSRVGEAIDFVILHRLREPFTFHPIHFPPPGDPRWRLPR